MLHAPRSNALDSSADVPAARRWAAAGLCALALLFLPVLTWLLFSPGAPAPARSRAASAEAPARAAAAVKVPSPQAQAPREQPAARRPVDTPAAFAGDGVEGDVQDPDGKPVAGASVTCKVGERELSAQSDQEGHFQLTGEAAGCAAVARGRGFGPSGEETLRAGSANRLRLTPPCGIAGTVVDETGAPVMTYWVAVESFEPAGGGRDGGGAPARKISLEVNDQEGAFEWTDLAPGRYALAVSAPPRPFGRSAGIEVRAGAMTRGVRIVVNPGVTVTGTIVDAKTRQPISGALAFVELGLDLGLKALPAMANNGEFKLEGAPAGVFDLHVQHLGYVEYVARGLRAPTGGEPLHVDVALRKVGEGAPAP